jgi:long-subunit acyl-CoA synthetase (AMP-forming)/acyl carrier protein
MNRLGASGRRMEDVYAVMGTFADRICFERLSGSVIVSTTYRTFFENVRRVAAGLAQKIEAHPQPVYIGLAMENGEAFVTSFWAILMTGGRPVLLNTRQTKDEQARVVAATGCVAVVRETDTRLPLERAEAVGAPVWEYGALPSGDDRFAARWENAFVLATSGTAGEPKLFLYDGEATCAQLLNLREIARRNPAIMHEWHGRAKALAFLPFYHIFGLVSVMLWFTFFGRTLVFLQDLRPETVRYTVVRHGVTHLFAIPLLWNGVAEHLLREARREGPRREARLRRALGRGIRLQSGPFWRCGQAVTALLCGSVRRRMFGPSIRFCINGGGYVKEDALRVFNGLGYPLFNGYGMTELGITSVELRRSAAARVVGGVGKPFPSVNYRIEEDGTLSVGGDSLFSGRVMPDGSYIPRDKTLRYNTADVFTVDKGGNYAVVGRRDELLKAENGELLVPDAVEKAFTLRYAAAYTVVGLRRNESTRLVLVVNPDPAASPQQVDEMLAEVYRVNAALPPNEKVARVLLSREPLPQSLPGKVQRLILRRRLEEGTFPYIAVDLSRYADTQGMLSERYKAVLAEVLDIFREALCLPEHEITPVSNFLMDLGGSSLAYFALLERLSAHFSVTFNLQEQFPVTPQEFAAYIVQE